ncbi:carbohydrate-binding module family 12 protein [Roridomyces roridus]|uniref:Carbohydrate-binding module family 12 protein n=1 Tax=Roridomyces roridus TaxID=1738132 RepID=A0AAD7CFL6_9AGAR|nr:carbohydrate-binding module family 12 protein [Roridomyces roridus]
MQYWEPGTHYDLGSVVEYNGHRYRIIQSHNSQSDWTPDVTPALWGRMQDGDHNEGHHNEGHQAQQHHEKHHDAPRHETQQPQVEVHHEEREKHWYDIDDHRKKELEIGGGLLAGAALLAGGYAAFKAHEKNEEEQKAQTWALSNWIREAEARTAQFYEYGPRGPATWVLSKEKQIPANAILVGREHSWNLFICRAFYEGGIQVGKASNAFKHGAVVGYKHEEIHLGVYEVLVGDMNGLRWVDWTGRLDLSQLGHRPVEGGRERDGTPLYIAEAPYNDAVHPGKASEKLDGAYIPYDSTEKKVESYRVLCYA